MSALDVWPFGPSGFQGLISIPAPPLIWATLTAGYADGGSDTFHFPDGNASIARLLVRSLIPQAVPGGTVEDVVTARIDYSLLDRPEDPIRIRLGKPCRLRRSLADRRRSKLSIRAWTASIRSVASIACSPAGT